MTERDAAMKKTTLAASFAALRQKRSLTLLAVANSCDLAETTVLKVEAGRPVRWETLHTILSVGFKIRIGTPEYVQFHELWLKGKAENAAKRPADFAKKKLSAHAAAAVKAFRNIIRDADEPTTRKAVLAAGRSVKKSLIE